MLLKGLILHDQHIKALFDTRNSSFSAKSSRHFESRSSLHVSDLAALTIRTYDTEYDRNCVWFVDDS